jgi:predicted PurR-regulated permease PerM
MFPSWNKGPDPAPRRRPSYEDGGLTDRDPDSVSVGWARSFSFAGTILIVGFLLVFLRSILVPFVAALFLAYLVRPLADAISACRCIPYLRRRHDAAVLREEEEQKEPLLSGDRAEEGGLSRRPSERLVKEKTERLIGKVETLLPRWVGVMLALILALGVIIGILAAMVVTITSFQAQMPKYRANAQLLWQHGLEWLKNVFNVDLSELQALPSRVFSSAAGTFLTTSVTLTTDLMLVIVFLAFILLQPPAPQSSLRKKIDDSVSRYIILKSVISFSVAIFVYVVLAAVGRPRAASTPPRPGPGPFSSQPHLA